MKKKIILLTGCGVLTLASIGATPIAREGRIIAADLTPLYLSGKESYFQYSTSVIEGKPLIVKCFIVNDLYPNDLNIISLNFDTMKKVSNQKNGRDIFNL